MTTPAKKAGIHSNGWVEQSQFDLQEYIQNVGGSNIQNENLTDVPLALFDGQFQLGTQAAASFMLGDIDGDGVVRALDAALALQLASGLRIPTAQELQAGDINGNGVIQAADASMILYYAANSQWPPLPPTLMAAAAGQATTVALTDVTGRPGTTVQTTLTATGLQKMAGGDFVLVYDTARVQRINAVKLAGLANGFQELKYEDDGAGRLFFSLANPSGINGDGILATIDLVLAPGARAGDTAPLLLADAKLNDVNGRDFVTSFADNTLTRQNGTLTVGNLSTTPAAFTFSAKLDEGDPQPQKLQVDSGAVDWNATINQDWIQLSSTSGQGASEVDVYVYTSGLEAGVHTGSFEIVAGSESSQHEVTLVLNDPAAQPVLMVTPSTLSFTVTPGGGGPAPQSFTVQNSGTGALAFALSSNQSWLQVDEDSGVAPATISVSINAAGLTTGVHSGQLVVTAEGATGSPKTVSVQVTVGEGPDVDFTESLYLPTIIR